MLIKGFAATEITGELLGLGGGKTVGFTKSPVVLGSGGVGGVVFYLEGSGGGHECQVCL